MQNQTVLVLDFGGQYKELIARRIRECGVYSLIIPGNSSIERIRSYEPIGIVLTGGPNSVYAGDAPSCSPEVFQLGVPVLGICYGHQLMCHILGGQVRPCEVSEYGEIEVQVDRSAVIFEGLEERETALMSHTDQVVKLPYHRPYRELRGCRHGLLRKEVLRRAVSPRGRAYPPGKAADPELSVQRLRRVRRLFDVRLY